jgi:hypothetical protein
VSQEDIEMSKGDVPSTLRGEAAHMSSLDGRTKTLEALLANGWEVTKWQRERIDARDRLAVQILAFAGVILALMPNLLEPLRTVHESRREIVTGLAATTALLLIAASILALVAVAAPSRRRPTQDRLVFAQALWLKLRDQEMSTDDALKELLDQLIGVPGYERPFLELAAMADHRERITRLSATTLGIGVVLMAIVLGLLLLG